MKKFVLPIVLFPFLLGACQDDFGDYGYVNFFVEPESTEFYNLNYGNRGWEYFEGGYRGIIIYRKNWKEFMAYERSCTAKDCKGELEVDTISNVLIYCPNCGSNFLCVDGSPLSGSKAKRMLYNYCCFFDNDRLWVYNCQ